MIMLRRARISNRKVFIEMGKSHRNKAMYDDFDYEFEFEDEYSEKSKKDDKKRHIQEARRKAQAERDKAVAELMESVDE